MTNDAHIQSGDPGHNAITSSGSNPATTGTLAENRMTRFIDVELAEVETIADRALARLGYKAEEIPVIREVLLYAELRGNSQGLIKLIKPGFERDKRATEIVIENETAVSARINGNYCPAMVVLYQACELAVDKALKHGMATVGTYRTNQSTGANGYFANLIAERECIGTVLSGTPAFVAPIGASEACYGTNPIAFGAPAPDGSVVSDITTSAVAFFEAAKAKELGHTLPPGSAFDATGQPTVDPALALNGGAFTSMDHGARGSALGWNTSVLTGPFVGADPNRIGQKNDNWGNLVTVWRRDLLVDANTFDVGIQELSKEVRVRRPIIATQPVRLPGERGNQQAKMVQDSGLLRIPATVWEQVLKLAE